LGNAVGERYGQFYGEFYGQNLAPFASGVSDPDDIFSAGKRIAQYTPASIVESGGDATSWEDTWNSNDMDTPGNAPAYLSTGGANGYAAVQGDRVSAEYMRALGLQAADGNLEVFAVIRADEYINNRIGIYAVPSIQSTWSTGVWRNRGQLPFWLLDSTVSPGSAHVGLYFGYNDADAEAWHRVNNESLLEATGLAAASVAMDISVCGSTTGTATCACTITHIVCVTDSTAAEKSAMAAFFNSQYDLATELTW
jgi:hypothetical protein